MNSGMDRTTGKPLTGIDHLRQSILDILSTRIGSRVMRRDYGSRVAELIDAPVNNAFAVALYAAVAEALDKWEPRFKLKKLILKWLMLDKFLCPLKVFICHPASPSPWKDY